MKVMTVLGTRPEITRLSGVIRLLDEHADRVVVHTGQNYHGRLSRISFGELGVRAPDVDLEIWPETLECGSDVFSGADRENILWLAKVATASSGVWRPPAVYLAGNVSRTVCRILPGYRTPDPAETAWRARNQRGRCAFSS